MRKFKNLLALGMVAIMSVALVGCGSDSSSDDDDEDDDQKSKVSAESVLEDINTEDIDNFSAALKVVVDAEIDYEEVMDIDLTLDMDMDCDGNNAYLNMALEGSMMGEENSMEMEMYVAEDEDGNPIVYFNQDGSWYYQAMEAVENSLEVAEPTSFTEYIKEAEIVDEDDDTYVIECVIDFEKLYEDQAEALEDSEAGDIAEEYEDMINEMMAAFEEMEITYEIDKDSNSIMSVEMDMTKAVDDVLAALTDLSEGEMDFSEMVKVNKLSFEVEYENYGDAKVEIPSDVTENATDGSLMGGSISGEVDEDAVDVHGNEINVYDYSSEEYITTITIPEGFGIREDYAARYNFAIEDDNWNVFYFGSSQYYEITNFLNGEYESNTVDYLRDEIVEFDSIETNQGTVRVFARIWCMSGDPQTDYYADYYFVLNTEDGYTVQMTYYSYNNDTSDFTLEQLNSYVQEIFQ